MLSNSLSSTLKKTGFIFTQIRTATKKAAGSRTSMKDSAGRRLGPKKYNGQEVKVGEIIMRQRGTKFFPGEYVGIGKDHTLFALEPGFVRYYLDPFHPKRKFIGVGLNREAKLPTNHFDPTPRRFGHILLDNTKAARKEESALSRKEFLAKDSILADVKARGERRNELMESFKSILSNKLKLDIADFDIATEYLLRLRNCLRNGFLLGDAQFYAKRYLEMEYQLKANRENIEEDVRVKTLEDIESITATLNSSISFTNKYDLIAFISEEEKKEERVKLINQLREASESIKTKKDVTHIKNLFKSACNFLSLSDEVHLRRTYLKPIFPEASEDETSLNGKGKKVVFKRFNYETEEIDTIERGKTAFLNKL